MSTVQAHPKLDLRSHTMFATKGEEKGSRNRDKVRLRLRSRHLNNTHLVERHTDIHNEHELLEARQESFRSYANVGIEWPLLLSPSPRIHATRRRRVKREKQPDVLTLDWEPITFTENSPYIDEGPDDLPAPEWAEVLTDEKQSGQSAVASFALKDPVTDPSRPKLPNQKSVTWKAQQGLPDEDLDAWMKLVSPAYQRHLERHRHKPSSKPPFERYAIGALRKGSYLPRPTKGHPGIHLQPLSREASLASGPGEKIKQRTELHPVTSGLRNFGTAPEQIRWRHLRPGEWNVRKVWDREVSDFSSMPLMQIAREDTEQYFNQVSFS